MLITEVMRRLASVGAVAELEPLVSLCSIVSHHSLAALSDRHRNLHSVVLLRTSVKRVILTPVSSSQKDDSFASECMYFVANDSSSIHLFSSSRLNPGH